ncbi:MAG: SulP family inorganic anion transporter [Polynucleobacter sp.]|uniref:SulP family inorganic anion transporter n=1 Tax=Polynucleobacter sp. TaxID=2029855 RepID=UPI00271D45D3|nr:SulP family inorganic anion transporter [Polynucleobacter sp.]MDO8713873.1 SulP family inorganic anion transporter [Polynucleobacter sp.]
MITILEAKRAGMFGRGKIISNVVAGVIVGIVALPLAMAFAIASGARPEQGLYTAIIGGFMVTVLGGSRVQIAGPTGAFIAILIGITTKYGFEGLQIATLMAGLMLVAMGLAKMGGVIKFIPSPVIVGFTAGIAVIIFVGQWKDFFGLPKVTGDHFHEKLLHLVEVLPQFHQTTLALAILSLLLVLFSSKIRGMHRVPGPLTAMVVATVLQSAFHFDGVATIGSAFGGIPQGLPSFKLPSFSMTQIIQLLGPAFTIAMLGAIESLLSAVVADGMTGEKHDSNQELIGQGLANIAAPLFGGFAATGAIARTATNIRNGATSPLAGIMHTLTLLAILLFLAPFAAEIPLAALAAILFVVAYNMSEMKHFAHIVIRAPRADVVILVITFLLTVFADLVIAVNVGVILAMFQFLRRMSDTVEVQKLDVHALKLELKEEGLSELPTGVLVFEIDGPFFFGAVENFERALLQTGTDPKILIVRLRRVPFMDITGLQTIEEVFKKLQKRGIRVMMSEANHRVRAKLWKANVLTMLQKNDYSDSFSNVLKLACTAAAESESAAKVQ